MSSTPQLSEREKKRLENDKRMMEAYKTTLLNRLRDICPSLLEDEDLVTFNKLNELSLEELSTIKIYKNPLNGRVVFFTEAYINDIHNYKRGFYKGFDSVTKLYVPYNISDKDGGTKKFELIVDNMRDLLNDYDWESIKKNIEDKDINCLEKLLNTYRFQNTNQHHFEKIENGIIVPSIIVLYSLKDTDFVIRASLIMNISNPSVKELFKSCPSGIVPQIREEKEGTPENKYQERIIAYVKDGEIIKSIRINRALKLVAHKGKGISLTVSDHKTPIQKRTPPKLIDSQNLEQFEPSKHTKLREGNLLLLSDGSRVTVNEDIDIPKHSDSGEVTVVINNKNIKINTIRFIISSVANNVQDAGRKTETKTIRKKLEQLTVKELKERCVKRKIKSTGLKKAELIVALRR